MTKPYYQRDGITIYHGDCKEILPSLSDIDAIITDPPYGIDHDTKYKFTGGVVPGNTYKPIHGDKQPFEPNYFLNAYRKVLFWGANCYKLYMGTLLIWDKRIPGKPKNVMSDAEVAWLNTGHGVYIFNHTWEGFIRDSEQDKYLHPTQKPVILMEWCIQKANPKGVICDPYMGSGATLEAARNLGFECMGIDIEKSYCEIAVERLRQSNLFTTVRTRQANNRLQRSEKGGGENGLLFPSGSVAAALPAR